MEEVIKEKVDNGFLGLYKTYGLTIGNNEGDTTEVQFRQTVCFGGMME